MKRKKSLAWAIKRTHTDLDGKVYIGLLGIYYFGHDTPRYSDGNKIALFSTRRIARQYVKEAKTYAYLRLKFKVVRAEVTIQEI